MEEIDIFVGRQPILNRDGELFAYELLYRNSKDNFFPGIDSDKATIGLLVNTFLSIGIENVAGGSMAFINFSGELLAKDIFTGLRPDKVVIEILEDVEITPSLLTKMKLLKTEGFKLALDDFILQKQYMVHKELFEIIDFVKVDFVNTTLVERLEIETFIKKYPDIVFLAEKIETEQQFKQAEEAGYKLFQGYFFAEPEIITGIEIPTNVSLHFQIIEQFNRESPNIDIVADLITRDISLSYKLLRLMNTLVFEVPKRISSIKQAIMIIGMQETKKWMLVLALREMGEGIGKGRIKALVDYSLTRAKMCELLAEHEGKKNAEEYFLAGMFSLINVITKRDWDDILELIPLSDIVARTLKGEQTEITQSLQLAEAIERFDWGRLEQLAEKIDIDKAQLSAYSLEVHRWIQNID